LFQPGFAIRGRIYCPDIFCGPLRIFIAPHFTYACYNRPGFFFPFFAKGLENGYHGDGILRGAGHNEGIADKAEVDSPGFMDGDQVGLVSGAP
jgi:hypothetical protein